jgi:hypothetical protein
MTTIVELRSRDEAARARVALQGKYLLDGCCYIDVKFASPYEWASMATSTDVVTTTTWTACVMHEGVPHIELAPEAIIPRADPCKDITVAAELLAKGSTSDFNSSYCVNQIVSAVASISVDNMDFAWVTNSNVTLPMLGNFNFKHNLPDESDSLCSDTIVVPMPHVFDGIPMKSSANTSDDMSQDDQGLLNTEEVQFTASNGVASTLKQLVFSQIKFGAIHIQFAGPLHPAPVYWPFLGFLGHSWFLPDGSCSILKAEDSTTMSWFQFCSTGKASLYGYYDAEQFHWAIAWPAPSLLYSIPSEYINCKSTVFPDSLNGRAGVQHIMKGSFGLAIVDWTPWTSWFVFQSTLDSQEFYASIKIERLLELHSSCDQFITKGATYFDAWYFGQIPWYFCPYRAISSSNSLRMQQTSDHWAFRYASLFSWEVANTIDSVTTITHISAIFSTALQRSECWSKLMLWEIASSSERIMTLQIGQSTLMIAITEFMVSWNSAILQRYSAYYLTTTHAPDGMRWHLTLEFSTVICCMRIETTSCDIRSICVMHLHWDPGGFALMAFHKSVRISSIYLEIKWFLVDVSYGSQSDSCLDLEKKMMREQLITEDTCTPNWQNSTNLQHPSLDPATVKSQRTFSWDPGIWTRLYFYHGTCKRDQAKEGRHAQPASHGIDQAHLSIFYYISYDCYFDNVHADNEYWYKAFLDCICCYLDHFNMVQIPANHGYYRSYSSDQEDQVQWDPGGPVWRRLGVKPKFKERGLLATYPIVGPWAGYWAGTLGLGPARRHKGQPLHIPGNGYTDKVAWNWKASAWHSSLSRQRWPPPPPLRFPNSPL